MNERIIELAEQAGLEYNFDPMLWLKHEKFAELIVRECAAVAYSYDPVEPVPSAIAKLIQTHFGVEE